MRIEAMPKEGAPVVWGKIEVDVRDDNVITQQVFFDQEMKPARKMLTEKIALLGGRSYPVIITMYPQDRAGEWTRSRPRMRIQHSVARSASSSS